MLLLVSYGQRSAVVGPTSEETPIYKDVDPGQAERVCREALARADRIAALRALRDSLPALETTLGGVRNEGFLATYELTSGAPDRPDFAHATVKARKVVAQRDESLLKALGFDIAPCDNITAFLRSKERKVALAVLLKEQESPDLHAERFAGLSPVSYALAVADRENVPYVLTCQGGKLRLYPTKPGVGVAQRARTETFVECNTALLRDSELAYLWLLFSAEALAEGGTLEQLLEESSRFAGSLAAELRERIYDKVMPELATAISAARGARRPKAAELRTSYEMALLVLFRLLFIAYAEDKDLLPYKWSEVYRKRSLKEKARELKALASQPPEGRFDGSTSRWDEIDLMFRAVAEGNREWSVPAYDGGLFAREVDMSQIGHQLAAVHLTNDVFGPILADLFLVPSPEGLQPIDFRTLGVREFGTIYEGLLESELALAEDDLVVDDQGHYRPAKRGEQPRVRKGAIYLHDRSGSRKSTGSYFTKSFAVEHLLDRALEPALAEHLARLDKLDDDVAAEHFFDFRVADIAMGSAHFLVAAVDRIERGLSGYLARRSLAGVRAELMQLRQAAQSALGPLAEQIDLEDTALLRRLAARRCIYGVDLNPMSVQLARLSIWIHTFVPGLPLSFLDHNLVVGNSLIGIADLKEVEDMLRNDDVPLLRADPTELLASARKPLHKLARLNDATLADVKRAREAAEELRAATTTVQALCDIVTAARVRGEAPNIDIRILEKDIDSLFGSTAHRRYQRDISQLEPFHFPVAFPEVFLRSRSGFDVILGNPPWEEATLEELAFWARHFPGLRGLPSREKEREKARFREDRPDLVRLYEEELADAESVRKALLSGAYPGMGTGDPDLYKGFAWRFWTLVAREGGRLGVVLPRSAFNAQGSGEFRKTLFGGAREADITFVLNTGGWVFDDAEPRYTIGFVTIVLGPRMREDNIALSGPYPNLVRFNLGTQRPPHRLRFAQIESWNDEASLPLLPADESLDVFLQLRTAPRLDLNVPGQWRVRPHRELDATNEKDWMDLESEDCPRGYWPVYKGESFDLWQPDTESHYAWANPKELLPYLQDKRLRSARRTGSVFAEFDRRWLEDPRTLPCLHARIAFRDISRATDSRTVRVALIPPKVFVANQAPFLLWPRGDEKDQAFLLGVLASQPLDWYARRYVETHLNYFVFNPLPVPRPAHSDKRWQRVVALAGRLAAPDRRFAAWAEAVSVDVGELTEARRQDMIHELDAVVAHLFGLSEAQLTHIFETFHEGWDYARSLKATLKHYAAWAKR